MTEKDFPCYILIRLTSATVFWKSGINVQNVIMLVDLDQFKNKLEKESKNKE